MPIKAPSVRRELDIAIRSHRIAPRGGAAVALARRLASDLDGETDPEVAVKLAGQLAKVLELLGMTMKAETSSGGVSDGARSALDQLTERRARLHKPAAGD